jgi:biopolymer transport protein ExbD
MKSSRNEAPKINAGSMADIAFLLLIFFLVTTTMSVDKGILRKLPTECPPGIECIKDVNERNILRISLNSKQEILINNKLVTIDKVKVIVKEFVDNNGDTTCNYCNGLQNTSSSDNPKEAVISLQHQAKTKYNLLIEVQDELTKAYFELRETYSKSVFNKTSEALSKEELKKVKSAYPFTLSEAYIKTIYKN